MEIDGYCDHVELQDEDAKEWGYEDNFICGETSESQYSTPNHCHCSQYQDRTTTLCELVPNLFDHCGDIYHDVGGLRITQCPHD